MKNKNGFTLVELLTIVTIIAVLIILLLPVINKSLRSINKALKDIDKNALIDSTKLYVNNLVNNGYNVVSTNHYDASCNFINTTQENKLASYINNGVELSGYRFVEYAAQNDLYITAEYLVQNGYFDNGCIYDTNNTCEKSTSCKVDKACTLVVHFNSNTVKANPNCTSANCEVYYVLGDYSVNIQDEAKCVIK